MEKLKPPKNRIDLLYENVKNILEMARNNAYRVINTEMVQSYWNVGRVIVEEEQKGEKRADYEAYLIAEISNRLTREFGRGFDRSNVFHMKRFYLLFPKVDAVRRQLTWTHYRLILKVENENARGFYLNETINSNWSTRELDRQINSLLYERIALSKDKNTVKELSKKGQILKNPEDLVKDPYVLEFLEKDESIKNHETKLEQVLVEKLKQFLLELGKGFSFVSRQKRITLDGDHFYIDLVFYNYILKCFVLIDLKIGKLTHQDIGQMDFYVRYFEKEEKLESDNMTIGIVLCSSKNETMVKYTLLNDKKNIFASKYKLYLPSEEELKKELQKEREFVEGGSKDDELEKTPGIEVLKKITEKSRLAKKGAKEISDSINQRMAEKFTGKK